MDAEEYLRDLGKAEELLGAMLASAEQDRLTIVMTDAQFIVEKCFGIETAARTLRDILTPSVP